MNNMYKILESFDSLSPVKEARTLDPELQKIAHNYPREVKLLLDTGDFDKDLYSALFDFYNGSGEMPYGVAKARDGDPYEWIFQRFTNDMGTESPLSGVGADAGLGLNKAIQDVEEEIATYGGMGGAGSMGGMTESSADLYRKWSNITEGKKAKPDFLDLDKDGNKKEPMKKAAKEVKEAAKPDFLDLDKDGNKKEPMKKAAKEVKESDYGWDYPEPKTKPSNVRKVAGKAYGGSAQVDEPEDDDDSKPAVKKGRGRPAGTKRAIGAKGPTGKSKLMKKGAIKEQGDEDMEEGWRGGMLGEPPIVKTREKYAGSAHQAALQELYDLVTSPWIKDSVDAGIRKHLVRLAKQLKATEGTPVAEKAPPGAKAERMVKGIKKSLSKDGHLSDKDKAIAYATTWKAHKQGRVEEEAGVEEGSTGDYSAKKARAGKDIGKPGKNFEKIAKSAGKKYGSKAAGERVAGAVLNKLRGKNESKDEEQVEETTCAGSVAVSVAAPKKASAGGYQFGQGVYESINNQVEKMIVEGMSINVNVDTNGQKSINVSATEEDADKLAEILKMAGIGSQISGVEEDKCCEACGANPCECSMVEESNELANGADDTEYSDTDMMTMKLAGGLNKPKTTVAGDGQTTIPVTAVQVKESQEVAKIENSLWNLFKAFKK